MVQPKNIELLTKILKRDIFQRYTKLIFFVLIISLLFNLLILPSNLVLGDIGGLSIILKRLYDFEPAIVIFITSMILLLFSRMYLGKMKTLTYIPYAFLFPIFVLLTTPITKVISLNIEDPMMIAIYVGIIGGFCNGFIYKNGFNGGNFYMIGEMLHKYFRISPSTSLILTSGTILIVGGIFFGWTAILYAIIVIVINSIIVDRVTLGISKNKIVYIVTNKTNEVNEYIINDLNHTTTMIDVKKRLFENKKLLLAVIPTSEYFKLTKGIKIIDSDVFYWVNDAYEVENSI